MFILAVFQFQFQFQFQFSETQTQQQNTAAPAIDSNDKKCTTGIGLCDFNINECLLLLLTKFSINLINIIRTKIQDIVVLSLNGMVKTRLQCCESYFSNICITFSQ